MMIFERLNPLFLKRLDNIYSKEDIKIIKSGFEKAKRQTTFRVNTIKSTNEDQENYFRNIGVKIERISFLPNAYKIIDLNGFRVAELRGFETGEFYLQGITSQLPVEFLTINNGLTILDVSAAPGGKTSQISSKLNNTGKVIANEINTIRREKLKATIRKQFCKNVEVIGIDARNLGIKYKAGTFDAILFDAPCSAEGRINLSEEKIWPNWSEENINKNSKLQKEILDSIIPLLKKGGELVYSTCTLAPEENEEIVDFILSKYNNLSIQEIALDYNYARQGICEFNGKKYNSKVCNSLRILPNEDSEGFFVAKFINL
nr:RsmB/NOP family class I SAM-dependent RNA methyltransferase [Candidatus Gracilibacteria bacterium]